MNDNLKKLIGSIMKEPKEEKPYITTGTGSGASSKPNIYVGGVMCCEKCNVPTKVFQIYNNSFFYCQMCYDIAIRMDAILDDEFDRTWNK